MKQKTIVLVLMVLLCALANTARAGIDATLKGRVIDARTGEALVGATLQIVQAGQTAVSNENGEFVFRTLGQRNYTLVATYLGYHRVSMTINPARTDTALVVRMSELESSLGTATVTATVKRNTEASQVAAQRNSLVVQSGISAQQIAKSQDKDASEVIRRVPGISIIDQKFVMVRGLSQRYNNVWINGAAVPSSEADSRAFSFDIIPSSQVDNMQIIKSPAPPISRRLYRRLYHDRHQRGAARKFGQHLGGSLCQRPDPLSALHGSRRWQNRLARVRQLSAVCRAACMPPCSKRPAAVASV